MFISKKQDFVKYLKGKNLLITSHDLVDLDGFVSGLALKFFFNIFNPNQNIYLIFSELSKRTKNYLKNFSQKFPDFNFSFQINKEFSNVKELKGILIGGPGPTKETFFEGNYLHNELKKKVIGLRDLSYTGEFGLKELVDKSHDLLAKEIIVEERKILDKFFGLLATETEKVAYGEKEVKHALVNGAVDRLVLSDLIVRTKKGEELLNMAKQKNSEFTIINTMHEAGKKFDGIGGIAALLRFKF